MLGKLTGEYSYSIDSKGRLVIPGELRSNLGDTFFLVRGLEKCLYIYPMKEWEKVVEKIENLPLSNPYARSLQRFFGSGCKECQCDKQGRIAIPSGMASYAGISKKTVLVGVFNKIEIWDEDLWNEVALHDYVGKSELSDDFVDHVKELGI